MPSKRLSKGEQARLAGWEPVGLTAGVDEAGRGPLAGPVVAAAVVIAPDRRIRGLADSKVLPSERREELFAVIHERAVAVGVGIVDHLTIDRINILEATRVAMGQALAGRHAHATVVAAVRQELADLRRRLASGEMPDGHAAQTAIDTLNGTSLAGRALTVNAARPRAPRRELRQPRW